MDTLQYSAPHGVQLSYAQSGCVDKRNSRAPHQDELSVLAARIHFCGREDFHVHAPGEHFMMCSSRNAYTYRTDEFLVAVVFI